MSVNSMNFEDSSTLLSAVLSQATGEEQIAPVDERGFVSMGTTALKMGYDPLATAVSQVLSRTVFAIRDYIEQFPNIERDSIEWGGIVRKVTPLDTADPVETKMFDLVDGQSIDQYIINKQKAVQLNFYGGNTYDRYTTITREQLKTAFTGSMEFGSFMAMQMTNIYNQIKQTKEAETRACVLNLIGAKVKSDARNVIYLFDEYKAETGNSTITEANYMSEAEFPAYAKWLYGYVATLKGMMAERTSRYHFNLTNYNGAAVKPIMRFTRGTELKMFMINKLMKHLNTQVLASVYNPDKLDLGDINTVNFWQSIDSPMEVKVKPVYLDEDGNTIENDDVAVELTNVAGIMFDRDACGLTVINDEEDMTPFNARGKYWDIWWNWICRWYNDITENCVVLINGSKPAGNNTSGTASTTKNKG